MTTERTPREIDTELADLWNKADRASSHLDSVLRSDARRPGTYAAEIARLRAELATLRERSEPLEREYANRLWKRYFLVTNGNGHVHRGRTCATCFPTTRYGWLPALSGCDESAMVAEYGEQACTVCFPAAPSLYADLKAKGLIPTNERERNEKRAALAAKRSVAAAKTAAKAITNPDGSPLKGLYGIRTVSGAWDELLRARESLNHNVPGSYVDEHRAEYGAAVERITTALAAKLGRDPVDILGEATKRQERRDKTSRR